MPSDVRGLPGLARARGALDLTLRQLSDMLVVDGFELGPAALNTYERGTRRPKADTAQAIAARLGVTVEQLLTVPTP